MAIADNQVVSIEYEVKDADSGEILDSNLGMAPLNFITGKNQVIVGLERELQKLNNGDQAQIRVIAQDAYGEKDADSLKTFPAEQFMGIDLKEGMVLYGEGDEGQTVQVVVHSFDEAEVTIDFSHPLAGRDLLFNVSILDVREPTLGESMSGVVESDEDCGCGCGHH